MSATCPKCDRQIIPMDDGRWPRCRATVIPPEADPSGLAVATIREGDDLPDVCAVCGKTTTRRQKVALARGEKIEATAPPSEDARAISALLGVAGLVVPGVGLLAMGSASPTARSPQAVLRLKIPVCASCKKDGRARPRRADFDRCTMTFVVDMKFRKALEDV